MKQSLVLLICYFGLGYTSSLESFIETFEAGPQCLLQPNLLNPTICISKTQFVLDYQDPERDTPLQCPAGTVCADVLEICSATASPVCYNDVLGAKGACNICDPLINSPVCVNKSQFSFCTNNKIIKSMTYSCMAPTPNCKATFDSQKKMIGICTAAAKEFDCPA